METNALVAMLLRETPQQTVMDYSIVMLGNGVKFVEDADNQAVKKNKWNYFGTLDICKN